MSSSELAALLAVGFIVAIGAGLFGVARQWRWRP